MFEPEPEPRLSCSKHPPAIHKSFLHTSSRCRPHAPLQQRQNLNPRPCGWMDLPLEPCRPSIVHRPPSAASPHPCCVQIPSQHPIALQLCPQPNLHHLLPAALLISVLVFVHLVKDYLIGACLVLYCVSNFLRSGRPHLSSHTCVMHAQLLILYLHRNLVPSSHPTLRKLPHATISRGQTNVLTAP